MNKMNTAERAELDVVSHLHPCEPAQPTRPETSFGAWVNNLFATLKRAAQMRADRARLMAMDDRQLDDIGLSRGDIENVINGTYKRPTAPLPAAAEPRIAEIEDRRLAA